MIYDVVIVGGGAAGLCAAVSTKQGDNRLNVAVVEQLDRVGKKLITTGNGQCNITNKYADKSHYHSADIKPAVNFFGKEKIAQTVDFFKSIGVDVVFNDDGRAYPRSYQAGSVVDCLRFSAEESGVETFCGTEVTDIEKDKIFILKTNNGVFKAKSIIVASGLYSGGEKIGSSGSLFMNLKNKGFSYTKTTPAIVPLKTETVLTRQLKGVKINALVSLCKNGKVIETKFGEVLFTDYGLSGPPVMHLAREVSRSNSEFVISLDLLPDISQNDLKNELFARRKMFSRRISENFLNGVLNKKLGQTIIKTAEISFSSPIFEITDRQINVISRLIKKFDFKVTGTTGFVNSQVTAGGISLTELKSDSLESKRISGMFFAGEILDIDGDCGGFNLQWAWTSGIQAAKEAELYLGRCFN